MLVGMELPSCTIKQSVPHGLPAAAVVVSLVCAAKVQPAGMAKNVSCEEGVVRLGGMSSTVAYRLSPMVTVLLKVWQARHQMS